DGGADGHGGGAGLAGGAGMGGGVHASLCDQHGGAGQLICQLFDQCQVGTVGAGARLGVAGQGGADDLDPGVGGEQSRLEAVAVGHQRPVEAGPHSLDGLGEGAAVGAGTGGAIQGEDVRAGVDHCQAVLEGGSDQHALGAVL